MEIARLVHETQALSTLVNNHPDLILFNLVLLVILKEIFGQVLED